jgi:hypothetical protein
MVEQEGRPGWLAFDCATGTPMAWLPHRRLARVCGWRRARLDYERPGTRWVR